MEKYSLTMKKRIVMIEDNRFIREGICSEIENGNKYEVVASYSSCETALKNLMSDRPDLVLMDIELPSMNGIEGTKAIKSQLSNCLVLIVTVWENSDIIFQALCAGADGYLIKSLDIAGISKNIDEALAGGAPMSLSVARKVVRSFHRQQDSPLSIRESQVLEAISAGKSYSKIASDLFISKETVRSHIKSIYQKLQVNCKADALQVASSSRWLVHRSM